jgi:hypothetical protein
LLKVFPQPPSLASHVSETTGSFFAGVTGKVAFVGERVSPFL